MAANGALIKVGLCAMDKKVSRCFMYCPRSASFCCQVRTTAWFGGPCLTLQPAPDRVRCRLWLRDGVLFSKFCVDWLRVPGGWEADAGAVQVDEPGVPRVRAAECSALAGCERVRVTRCDGCRPASSCASAIIYSCTSPSMVSRLSALR
jgi:hypothetical protein